jgi:uncharacterized protein (TIGR03066 family)
MNIRKITSLLLGLLLCSAFVMAKGAQDNTKMLKGKWKLIKETEDGKEITPRHTHLVIEFTKKGEFTVTAAYEETHKGTYKLEENGTKIVLNDAMSKEEKTLTIEKLDKNHLNLGGFDGETTVIEMTPSKKGEMHLSHREHLVVNKWHCFESEDSTNIELVIEFHKDKTYVIIPAGFKIPVATGDWHIDDKEPNKILLDKKEDGEHLELEIVEITTHEIVLKSLEEGGITNHFRDEQLWREAQKTKK